MMPAAPRLALGLLLWALATPVAAPENPSAAAPQPAGAFATTGAAHAPAAPMPTRRRQLRAGSGGKKREAGGAFSATPSHFGTPSTGEETVVIVQYWEDFGDPPFEAGDGGGGDGLCLLVFYFLVVVAAASVITILCDPWWPPFEERGPGLMCMMNLSAVVWSWATIVVDDHAPEWMLLSSLTSGLDGTGAAKFWLVWIRMIAGCGTFIGCLFVRLHAVNALYIVKDQAEPAWWLIRLMKYVSPWVVISVLRLFILANQMESVAVWSINLGMGMAHSALWIWLVASIDRKPERRKGVSDVNITMVWIPLLTIGPSVWVGAAIDYDVVSYSTKLDPEYDPAIDDPDPESIKSRQIISSLLTMGLLLVYLCKTVVPLVWRFLRKHKNLAWMEEVYEGPFVDYRLKKLTPEERDRAGLVGRYEGGDPTVSFDDEDEDDGEVEPPPVSCCSRVLGGWRYEIETNEWNDADDTHSELRKFRTLTKFIVVEEKTLSAEDCHWDVMQFDRDAELQAAEVFRMIDADGDGHLDQDEMRKALSKLHGGLVDEVELARVVKEIDEDGNGLIDELEFVNWFKQSSLAHDLKKQARQEKKLQAAYAELGVAVGTTAHDHAHQALHTAVEVDKITGHHTHDGAEMERAWAIPGGA